MRSSLEADREKHLEYGERRVGGRVVEGQTRASGCSRATEWVDLVRRTDRMGPHDDSWKHERIPEGRGSERDSDALSREQRLVGFDSGPRKVDVNHSSVTLPPGPLTSQGHGEAHPPTRVGAEMVRAISESRAEGMRRSGHG